MGIKALISDIHGNADALRAVHADITAHKVDTTICLGDIVGYGPDPEACTDYVMDHAQIALMGNHDQALLRGPVNFNSIAAEVIEITRQRMKPGEKPPKPKLGFLFRKSHVKTAGLGTEHAAEDRWKFIEGLEETRVEGGSLYVHASPLEAISDYVFPDRFTKWWDTDRIRKMFDVIGQVAFMGHTHMPCAIDSDLKCTYPAECGFRLVLDPAKKYMINVGSVGQPRDGDPRACYLLFDDEKREIEWRRLTYDIDAVVKRSDAMCGVGNWSGARLRLGR